MNTTSGSNLVEQIEFRAIAPSSKTGLKGLDDALTKLNALDAAIKSIQGRISGLAQPVLFRKTSADIREMVTQAEKLGRFGKAAGGSFRPASMKPADLAKALGYDPKALEMFLTQGLLGGKSKVQQQMRRDIREVYNAAEGEFRSLAGASKGLSLFTKQYNPGQDAKGMLRTLLSGGATVSPPTAVQSPQSAPAPATGSRVEGRGKAKSKDAPEEEKEPSFADKMAAVKRQLAERLNTANIEQISAAHRAAAEQVTALVPAEHKEGTSKKFDDALAYAATQEKKSQDADQSRLAREGKVRSELVKLKDKQAADVDKARTEAIKEAEDAELAAQKERLASEKMRSRLRKDRAKAAAAATSQASARNAGLDNLDAVQSHWQNFIAMGGVESPNSGAMKLGKKGWSRELMGERQMGGGQVEVFRATIGQTNATMERYTKTVQAAHDAQSAWLGDFVKNTAKVAAWSLSVGVLYKTMGLIESSFTSLVNTGMQMARLDQVFKKVGGSTMELTSDVLHLAAANGRSTEEAMNSALQWARLGLSRVQINEAVTVSLMAANDANVSAAETTEKLQAIMQTYGLQVGQLRTVLGEIVQITNSYNVSTGQMLEGITRTAAAARQAGLPLQELMGILGATIGATGQTGANIGNAVKSITLALSNPALQDLLRSRYRIEVTTGGEQIKSMSRLLADLYVRYEKLGNLERQSMLFSVAGRTQANRLSAMLDNYVRSQTLAINAQLHLNAAEEENKKILATMHAQLQGVATEWDRLVVIQGNHGPVKALTEITKAFRELLSLANTPIGSGTLFAFMTLGTAAIAKTVLTGMTASNMQKSFVGRTFSQVGMAASELGGWTQAAMANFLGGGLASDVMFGSPTYGKRMIVGAPGMARGGGNPWASRNLNNAWSMNPFSWGKSAVEPAVGKLAAMDQSLMRWGASMGASNVAGRAFAGTLQAITRGLAVGLVALGEWLLPLAVIAGAIWAFNKAMDAVHGSTERAEMALAGFNSEAERANQAASAFGQAARLMSTVQNALSPKGGSMRPDDAGKMINQMAEVMALDEPNLKVQKQKTDEFRKQAQALLEQKNYAALSNLAEQARVRYVKAQRDEKQREFEALKKQDFSDRQELAGLSDADKKYRGIGRVSRDQKRAEIEERLAERQGKKVQAILDIDEEIANAEELQLSYSVEHLGALEKQRMALEGIAQIYGQLKANNPFEQAQMDLAKNKAQAAATQKQMESLTQQGALNSEELAQAAGRKADLKKEEDAIRQRIMDLNQLPETPSLFSKPGTVEFEVNKKLADRASFTDSNSDLRNLRRSIIDEMKNTAETELQGVQNKYGQVDTEIGGTRVASINKRYAEAREQFRKYSAAAGGIEGNMPLAEAQTRFQFGQQRAGRELEQRSYGYTAGDKLVRERKFLNQEIESIEQKIAETERSGNQALSLKSQLIADINLRNKNNLDLLERQAGVERDILQLKMDQNKEFMRSIFGAGPAEMLQKLLAFRSSRSGKPMSQGEFFAMGPEMRSNVGMLNPNFNPQMIELKNEQKQITDAILKAFGSVDPNKIDNAMIQFSGQLAKALEGLDKLLPTAAFDAATQSIDRLGSAADRAADALSRIVAGNGGGGGRTPSGPSSAPMPRVPQAGGNGGARGYSDSPEVNQRANDQAGYSESGGSRPWHYVNDMSDAWTYDDGKP